MVDGGSCLGRLGNVLINLMGLRRASLGQYYPAPPPVQPPASRVVPINRLLASQQEEKVACYHERPGNGSYKGNFWHDVVQTLVGHENYFTSYKRKCFYKN